MGTIQKTVLAIWHSNEIIYMEVLVFLKNIMLESEDSMWTKGFFY